MRSEPADTDRIIKFSFYVSDGATGRGVADNNVKWRMTRTGTGTYIYYVDNGLQVLSVVGTSHASGYFFVEVNAISENYFVVSTIGHNGTLGNIPHSLVCTALDNRP